MLNSKFKSANILCVSCFNLPGNRESDPFFPTTCKDQKLCEDTHHIVDSFAKSAIFTLDSFQNHSRTPEKVGKTFYSFLCSHKEIPPEHEDELRNPKTMDDIHNFLIKHKHISFFNFKLLKRVIETLGKPEDIARMDKYISEFTDFCKSSIYVSRGEVIFKICGCLFGENKRYNLHDLEDHSVQLWKFCGYASPRFDIV